MLTVTEAVKRRISVRAFKPDPVPGTLVRELLEIAHRAPSGGNLQPWRVYALAGEPLVAFKADVAEKMRANPRGEGAEYDVYPKELVDPYRSRRFQVGEDMYGTMGVTREDRPARLAWFARNYAFFGAPVGLFFCIDRRMGPPQWSDVGMFMQSFMLLAVERGLDTCPQEAWTVWHKTVAEHLRLPPELMLFSGMALGYRDDHAVNTLYTQRDRFDAFAEMRGFD